METDTENEKVLTPFLRSLLARGLDSSQGLLVIIDGGKGLKAAVKKAFRKRVLIQRCQWHKRENVVSYLSKGEQASLRKRLQSAYNRPEYKEALAALDQLHDELEERNQSAAGSLEEGIEETLTLHRLGVYGARKQPSMAALNRAINAGSTSCGVQVVRRQSNRLAAVANGADDVGRGAGSEVSLRHLLENRQVQLLSRASSFFSQVFPFSSCLRRLGSMLASRASRGAPHARRSSRNSDAGATLATSR